MTLTQHLTRFSRRAEWVEYFCEVVWVGTKVTVDTGQIANRVTSRKQIFANRFADEATAGEAYRQHLEREHPLWPEFTDEAVPVPERRFSSNPAIEAQVRVGDSPEAAAVYVDWLLAEGDPRGELAALARASPVFANDFLSKHPTLFGELDVCLGHELEIEWRHSLPRTVRLRRTRPTAKRAAVPLAKVFALAMESPVLNCVTELEIENGEGVSALMANATQAQLTRMKVFGPASGRLNGWLEALAPSTLLTNLRELRLLLPEDLKTRTVLRAQAAKFRHLSVFELQSYEPLGDDLRDVLPRLVWREH